MYIAMNRFRIGLTFEDTFIAIWKNRESHLEDVAGFQKFNLLHGPSDEEGTLFISLSMWDSQEAFQAWTQSDHFKKSHAGAKAPKGTYLGHPKFEGFEVITL